MKIKTAKQNCSRLNEVAMKNKKKKKKRLSEGAGAGYTVESTITFGKFDTTQTRITDIDYTPDTKWDYAGFIIEFECRATANVDVICAESYYYGFNDTRIENAPAEVTMVSVSGAVEPTLPEAEFRSLVTKNIDTITSYLSGIVVDNKIHIGAGSFHTAFNGVVMRTADGHNSYDDNFPLSGVDLDITDISADVTLTDDTVIEYIDKATMGEHIHTEYIVYSQDGEPIGGSFDNESDAINFAKSNNGVRVIADYYDERPDDSMYMFNSEIIWDTGRDNRATFGEDIENLTSLVDGKDDFGVEPTTAFTPSTSDAIQNYERTKKLMNKNFKTQRDLTGKFVKDQNKRANRAKTEDIKIVSEIALEDFDFWSGAKYVADKLSHDDFEQIEDYLTDAYPDGITDTDVNEFFWFEEDTIAEILGYGSWEDLEEKRENEEDIDEALSPTAITLATTLGTEIIKNPEVLDKLGNLVKTVADASPISKAIEAIKRTK